MKPEELSEITSEFFSIWKIDEGVYGIVAKPNTVTGGNSCIVDLGGKTLIFDTFVTLLPAKDLLQIAMNLTNNSEFIICNSHFHFDHVRGNQIFPKESVFLSSKKTRNLMSSRSREEISKNLNDWPNEQEKLRANLANEGDHEKRKTLQNQIDFWQILMDELPQIQIRLPDISFDSKITYHGTKRDVELITFGEAHTPGDVVLYLPKEKILHAADVVLNKSNFYMVDGAPNNWNNVLTNIQQLDFNMLIPGHGEIGDRELLETAMTYITDIETCANTAIEKKFTDDDYGKLEIPKLYESWIGGLEEFRENVKLMRKSFKDKNQV